MMQDFSSIDGFAVSQQVTYIDIMNQLCSNFIRLYAIFACIVLLYTLLNMFVFEVKDFKYKEDIRQAFNAMVLILSLFVCAVSIQYYFIQ